MRRSSQSLRLEDGGTAAGLTGSVGVMTERGGVWAVGFLRGVFADDDAGFGVVSVRGDYQVGGGRASGEDAAGEVKAGAVAGAEESVVGVAGGDASQVGA